MCVHLRLDFVCIFIFNQGAPVVVALRMSLAMALRVSIIITRARFFGVYAVPALYLSDFGQPKFVDVHSVVAEDRITASPSGVRTASCSSRTQSTPAILLTLGDSIPHSTHIEKITKRNRFYSDQTLKGRTCNLR